MFGSVTVALACLVAAAFLIVVSSRLNARRQRTGVAIASFLFAVIATIAAPTVWWVLVLALVSALTAVIVSGRSLGPSRRG